MRVKFLYFLYMLYTAKTAWGQIDSKEHWWYKMYTRLWKHIIMLILHSPSHPHDIRKSRFCIKKQKTLNIEFAPKIIGGFNQNTYTYMVIWNTKSRIRCSSGLHEYTHYNYTPQPTSSTRVLQCSCLEISSFPMGCWIELNCCLFSPSIFPFPTAAWRVHRNSLWSNNHSNNASIPPQQAQIQNHKPLH